MTELRFKLKRSTNTLQPYYWTLIVVGNGKVLCHSETYVSKADAIHSMGLVHDNARGSTYDDLT